MCKEVLINYVDSHCGLINILHYIYMHSTASRCLGLITARLINIHIFYAAIKIYANYIYYYAILANYVLECVRVVY